jgi:hypothetical protein
MSLFLCACLVFQGTEGGVVDGEVEEVWEERNRKIPVGFQCDASHSFELNLSPS